MTRKNIAGAAIIGSASANSGATDPAPTDCRTGAINAASSGTLSISKLPRAARPRSVTKNRKSGRHPGKGATRSVERNIGMQKMTVDQRWDSSPPTQSDLSSTRAMYKYIDRERRKAIKRWWRNEYLPEIEHKIIFGTGEHQPIGFLESNKKGDER